MATYQASLPAYDKQLHVLFLANDVLLKACASVITSSQAKNGPYGPELAHRFAIDIGAACTATC